MVALEILVNGKRLYTIGAADFGMLTAEVMWARIKQRGGTVFESFTVHGHGLKGAEDNHSEWPRTEIKIGDEVTIRVVDTNEWDAPAKSGPLESFRPETYS